MCVMYAPVCASICNGCAPTCPTCLPLPQMISLTLLLLAHQGAAAAGGVPQALLDAAGAAGVPLLCVAAFLTVYSLADYFRGLWRFF